MSDPTNNNEQIEGAAQQRVREAIDARKVADFTGLPEAERLLPAEFLQQLISGVDGELCCPVRIRGARISGRLRPPSIHAGSRVAVQFWDCQFDYPVDFSGAEFLVLRFVNCNMPAFIGASLSVRADLDLSGSCFDGVCDYESELSDIGSCAIHLKHARIGGNLNLASTSTNRFRSNGTVYLDGAQVDGDVSFAGAMLDGRGAPALSARSVVVGSNIELKSTAEHRFVAEGEVVLAASQIAGDLDCQGARLSNPDGRALHCEDLHVESVFVSGNQELNLPFEARGRLNFLTAVIDGSFFMTNARLVPGPDYGGLLKKGGPIALNLQQARISNALGLRQIKSLNNESKPVKGWFLLAGTQMTTILDDVDTGWPQYGYLDLDGATYSSIRHIGDGELAARSIRWLQRQFPKGVPNRRNFRPQPYEQLTRVLREGGRAVEANAIAVEKVRMRLAARVDRPWARVFPNLLMLVSNYGYSTNRAIVSFLVFVLLGSSMYATALFGFQQPFVPVEHDPAPVTYEWAFGLLTSSTENGCPGLDVTHYALDAALPVIDLAQDLRCRFTPAGTFRWFWLLLHSVYVLGGAALSAIVVLTLSGVLRQD